jgi:HPt (histidine-containing phosphotransfer) domain-containing protein
MNDDVLAPEVFGRLQQAMAGDLGGLADLCRDYLVDARRTVRLLEGDLLDRNIEQLRVHAHYLKGSSQMIGSKDVARCCAALEVAAKDADLTQIDELVKSVTAAIESAQREMVARLGIAIAVNVEPLGKGD